MYAAYLNKLDWRFSESAARTKHSLLEDPKEGEKRKSNIYINKKIAI